MFSTPVWGLGLIKLMLELFHSIIQLDDRVEEFQQFVRGEGDSSCGGGVGGTLVMMLSARSIRLHQLQKGIPNLDAIPNLIFALTHK